MTTKRTAFAALALLFAVPGLCRIAQAADHPNFLWLTSEDNSKHFLQLFDENGAETPNIAGLAEQGVCFDRAFSNAPVCSVARSTLATCCYAPRIGTEFHRKSQLVPLPEGLRMFPAYLRDAGYHTTNNSKKDYNAVEGEGVWDASSNKTSWRDREPGQPFFHQLNTTITHESSLHFPEADVTNKPTITDPATVFIPPTHPDSEIFRYTYARYHDRIQDMDANIGAAIARLEEDGLLEDTFIFYFGDHGGVVAGSKGYAYEVGLHVPLVVRIPKNWAHLVDLEPGTRTDGFVSFIDFGATVLHLAGLEVPEGMDGRPIMGPDVTAEDLASRDETFGHADRFDEKYDLVRTLRKGDFKYMRNYQPFNFDGLYNQYRYRMAAYREWRDLYQAGELNEAQSIFFEPRAAEALYDVIADPYETNNLAGDPAYADVLIDLRTRLADRIKGMPDLSFYPESELAKDGFNNPTVFGQAHQDDIAALVDVADLSLLTFEEAKPGIVAAIESSDPWQRYWGLISASSQGQADATLVDLAKAIAASDPENLVRVRAAEFLALVGAADPEATIIATLDAAETNVEANLILNTATLLFEGATACEFDFSNVTVGGVPRAEITDRYVNDRLNYIDPR
jgi:arylsulfatase A-like enzyme